MKALLKEVQRRREANLMPLEWATDFRELCDGKSGWRQSTHEGDTYLRLNLFVFSFLDPSVFTLYHPDAWEMLETFFMSPDSELPSLTVSGGPGDYSDGGGEARMMLTAENLQLHNLQIRDSP